MCFFIKKASLSCYYPCKFLSKVTASNFLYFSFLLPRLTSLPSCSPKGLARIQPPAELEDKSFSSQFLHFVCGQQRSPAKLTNVLQLFVPECETLMRDRDEIRRRGFPLAWDRTGIIAALRFVRTQKREKWRKREMWKEGLANCKQHRNDEVVFLNSRSK